MMVACESLDIADLTAVVAVFDADGTGIDDCSWNLGEGLNMLFCS